MPQVEARHVFEHDADKVWDLTGNFAGLHHWLPGVVECSVEGSGARDQGGNAVRVVTFVNGSVARESLESFDAVARRYRYAILSAEGFNANTRFEATFQVVSLAPQQCEVIWQAQFSLPADLPPEKADKAGTKVQQTYRFFLQHLATVLEKRAS
jgi:ribosome-associated toxin RatA of RatAB toxin-antitoxin module